MCKVTPMRSDSRMIDGTYDNIDHHAKTALPLVVFLEAAIKSLQGSLAEWKQGHNVHVIVTHDGRQIAFVPYQNKELFKGHGVSIRLKHSRSKYTELFNFWNIDQQINVMGLLKCLVEPQAGNTYLGGKYCTNN